MNCEQKDWYELLTPAERSVLEAYAKYHSYQAVAIELRKSVSVVDQQLLSVRRKLDVTSTAEALIMLTERRARLAECERTPSGNLPADLKPADEAFVSDPPDQSMEPPGGGMAPGAPLYVARQADQDIASALRRWDRLIRIRGPRQIGKTSLLARGLQQARQAGATVLVTDFQRLSAADTANVESFYFALARRIASQVSTKLSAAEYWQGLGSAVEKFEDFFESEILKPSASHVVWGIDEADSIFGQEYSAEIFSHIRGRFNASPLNPDEAWGKLTQVLTYSTEAHLLIRNLNLSPFNVGTAIELEDFTIAQVSDLNERYGAPLRDDTELERLYALVGGHPFLVRHCLYEMKSRQVGIDAVERAADGDFYMFAEHLDRLRTVIAKNPTLAATVAGLLRGESTLDLDSLRRLHYAGVIVGPATIQGKIRRRLYELFLSKLVL